MFVVRSANDELGKSLSSQDVAMSTFVDATDSAGSKEGHLKTVISI